MYLTSVLTSNRVPFVLHIIVLEPARGLNCAFLFQTFCPLLLRSFIVSASYTSATASAQIRVQPVRLPKGDRPRLLIINGGPGVPMNTAAHTTIYILTPTLRTNPHQSFLQL